MLPQATHAAPRRISSSAVLQGIAIAGCVLFGLAMIANNQMGGEGMWFWYDNAFLSGAKVYSQLHIALQPFYLLESAAWMRLVGRNLLALESLSLLHIFAMCAALYLLLRESRWPGWLKAITLFASFALTVCGHSYRFDDYHVVAEDFIFFGLLLLLYIARSQSAAQELRLAALLGFLCGITITTRVTDGAALIASAILCLLLLPLRRKLLSTGVLIVAAAATMRLTVALTGDSFSDYLSSSIFRAASSKGGTGSIFMAPFLGLRQSIPLIDKHVLVPMLAILAIGPLVFYFWRAALKYIIPLELAATAILLAVISHNRFREALVGSQINVSMLVLSALLYILPLVVLVRFLYARRNGKPWDAREVLVLLPLAEWASYVAGAGGNPLGNYYAPIVLLLLLIAVLDPFRNVAAWAYPDFAVFMILIAASSVVGKVLIPYSWQNYVYGPMFVNRQLYHHPVYGELYIDTDLLRFSQAVCTDIGSKPGENSPTLLAMPYPYPNYFCATPPWHNYVQTFFDNTTKATIDHLTEELNTAPPDWIVYQRQLQILGNYEHYYNHDRPIGQRALDELIMQKLNSGQWKLVEYSRYLNIYPGDGWYVIQTHP
jgi:hypothetical protein